MPFDPHNPADVEAFEGTLATELDEASVDIYGEDYRNHLGGSEIGDDCSARLWLKFRWTMSEDFGNKTSTHGQKLRLFQRGHLEEPNIIKLLRKLGYTVLDPPDGQKQWRVPKQVNGHFGGSIDGLMYLPERFGFTEKVLLEIKTSSTQEFRKLVKAGVKLHRPTHWSQMCVYGYLLGVKYALYLVVDKNTDAIYQQFVTLCHDTAKDLLRKAEVIINSPTMPPKISRSPTALYCRMKCGLQAVCHNGEAVDKNCRSCKNAVPVQDGQWHCKKWNAIIPLEALRDGCQEHEAIIN